jgi:hypothetical protein
VSDDAGDQACGGFRIGLYNDFHNLEPLNAWGQNARQAALCGLSATNA